MWKRDRGEAGTPEAPKDGVQAPSVRRRRQRCRTVRVLGVLVTLDPIGARLHFPGCTGTPRSPRHLSTDKDVRDEAH